MGNEDLLPKPLTDLPLPEKEIPAHSGSASQGLALRSYGTKLPLPKIIFLIIVFVLIFVGIAGGKYYLDQQKLKAINDFESCAAAGNPIQESYPATCRTTDGRSFTQVLSEEEQKNLNPDPTADWETYTNSKFSFEYPSDYLLKKTEASSDSPENISLEKNANYTKSGGMAGSNVLSKGIVINFTIWPKKDLSENELKSQFGSNVKIIKTTLGGKSVIKVEFEDNSRYFYNYSPEVLEISDATGFSSTPYEIKNYQKEYNQILSTFKFTDSTSPSPDTSSWKTYTNDDFGFNIKYPASWTINDQSYTTGGQEYIGFAIQGPLRKDIPESNGKSAYYIKVLKYDSKTNALIANTAYGPSGEQFIFQKEANDQAVTEVPVSIDFIENSAEYKTANQILATYIIDEGSSCGPNAGQAGDAKCPSGFTCKNINSSGIGSCTKN